MTYLVTHSMQTFEEIFSSGDPEVRTWFLVRNWYLPFIMCFVYLFISLYGPSFMRDKKPFHLRKPMIIFNFCIVITYIICLFGLSCASCTSKYIFSSFILCFVCIFLSLFGPSLMRDRKPFELRKPMIIFNFCVVMTYVTCLFGIAYYLPKIPWELFCKGGVVKKGDLSYTLVSIGWIAYLLKYIELLDTVFFVLRKKENLITFLHVVHHASMPILGWVVFRTEKSALQSVPVILNGIVHIIMYSYYGLAAMGPKFRKYLWWKKYLTQLQIVQFCLIILFVTAIAPFTGCTMVSLSYAMDIVFAPLFLFLFYNFYKSSFQTNMKKIK